MPYCLFSLQKFDVISLLCFVWEMRLQLKLAFVFVSHNTVTNSNSLLRFHRYYVFVVCSKELFCFVFLDLFHCLSSLACHHQANWPRMLSFCVSVLCIELARIEDISYEVIVCSVKKKKNHN